MRLLFVVQRYGTEVAGGAEAAARSVAEHLADAGHVVEVLTSRARSYVDWADHYPSGTEQIGPVRVHRLGVAAPRDPNVFGPLHARTLLGHQPVPLPMQRAWARAQGPVLPGIGPWLGEHGPRFDAVMAVTYLYATTIDGLAAARAVAPTVLMPTAHDERPLHLGIFDLVVRQADALAYLTPEEAELVAGRFGISAPGRVIGLGIDPISPRRPRDIRTELGLGGAPFLLVLGRLDPHKGATEAFDMFVAMKQRSPGPLKLVFVGEAVTDVDSHPDVVVTGFVDDDTKQSIISECLALVQPSWFESFSLALCEAWAHGKPALVQGRCSVLAGQARRSGGAIPYNGFGEFEAAAELLIERPELARRLGDNGREYVDANYQWPTVTNGYESIIAEAIERARPRLRRST